MRSPQNSSTNEPWDSLANKPLAEKTPRYYEPVRSGQDRPGLTRYQVLVGPGTAFERDGLSWADFSKGPANTFLVVEAAEPVPWSKPVDLAYDPNGPLPAMQCPYRKPVKYWCWELGSQAGFNATFADGSIRFIPADTDEKTIRQMITRN